MSLFLNPVNHHGDRVSWDRNIGYHLACWLVMMRGRAERQYTAMTGEAIADGTVLKGGELARLKAQHTAINTLIRRVDESWGYDEWREAVSLVDQYMQVDHADPGRTDPPSDANSDGIGESPRT